VSDVIEGIGILPVHLASSDVPLGAGPKKRCRYAGRTRTFTLTAQNPIEAILPPSDSRTEAWFAVWSATAVGTLFVSTSQAGAQGQAGGCLTVPFQTTAAAAAIDPPWYPLNTTDQVWVGASSAAYPVIVSVLSIYEETE
jgi:hypothetical protein